MFPRFSFLLFFHQRETGNVKRKCWSSSEKYLLLQYSLYTLVISFIPVLKVINQWYSLSVNLISVA